MHRRNGRLKSELEEANMFLCKFTLQHTATHCNTLQHTATHCYNTLLHIELEEANMFLCKLQCVAVCCSVLQCGAVRCSALQ